MNTYESCAVVRSFSSHSFLSPKLLFSPEKYRNVENSPFNKTYLQKYLLPAQENLIKFLPVLKFQISVFQKIFQLII